MYGVFQAGRKILKMRRRGFKTVQAGSTTPHIHSLYSLHNRAVYSHMVLANLVYAFPFQLLRRDDQPQQHPDQNERAARRYSAGSLGPAVGTTPHPMPAVTVRVRSRDSCCWL
jgi:hypothetical protein